MRWCITAFGGVVFAIMVLMVVFSLSKWALHKFDTLVDPKSVIDQRALGAVEAFPGKGSAAATDQAGPAKR